MHIWPWPDDLSTPGAHEIPIYDYNQFLWFFVGEARLCHSRAEARYKLEEWVKLCPWGYKGRFRRNARVIIRFYIPPDNSGTYNR